MRVSKRSIVLLVGIVCASPVFAQQAYPDADGAASALVDALGTQKADVAKLTNVLGAKWRDYTPEGVARKDVDAFLAKYRERHAIEKRADGKSVLSVGTQPWTFPIPITQGAKGWAFDLKAGADEVRMRRIGRNELDALESERAYHDAQMDYAEVDRDNDGVLEYAQKVISTDGFHDGLYWSDDDSGEISPLGALFADATPGSDWHGYHFRILDAQGPSAPGGAYKYKLGDNMVRGFALVGWPAKYGDTGVMTMIISHDGTVFEKDLGPGTDKLARAMKTFDPDSSWTEEKGGN